MTNTPTPSRSIASIPILAILLVLVLIAAGALCFAGRNHGNATVVSNNNSNIAAANRNAPAANQTPSNSTFEAPEAWPAYSNPDLGFTLAYPSTWAVETIGADAGMDRMPHDTIISEGTCPPGGPCEIDKGFCTIKIGTGLHPGDSDMDAVIDDVRVQAKNPIGQVAFAFLTGYTTDVSMRPPSEDGTTGVGPLYLIPVGGRILRAWLEKGFAREDCRSHLHEVLNTLFETVPSAPATADHTATSLREYRNDLLGIHLMYPDSWGPAHEAREEAEGGQLTVTFGEQNEASFGKTRFMLIANTADFAPGREIWYAEHLGAVEQARGIKTICEHGWPSVEVRDCVTGTLAGHDTATFSSRIDEMGGEAVLTFTRTFVFATGNTRFPAAALVMFYPEVSRASYSRRVGHPQDGYWSGFATNDTAKIDAAFRALGDDTQVLQKQFAAAAASITFANQQP
jgi:hypothetical protein